MMWVQVLEKGNGYIVYKVKGMELQETSCHSLEATKVDEIMASAFERSGCVNGYPAHTLTPVAHVSGIQMYSGAKSSLTGVIEAPDTLKSIAAIFVRVLVHRLVSLCHHDINDGPDDDDVVVDPVSALAADESSAAAADMLRPSSSIEAVNLNSWPASSSESTPEQMMVDRLAESSSSSTRPRRHPGSAWTRNRQSLEYSDEESYTFEDVKRRPTRYYIMSKVITIIPEIIITYKTPKTCQ